jgi:hypothetical protein
MALKRKLKWLGAVIATLVLCAAAAWILWPAAGQPITLATYEQFRPGMTREEVDGVLGCPGRTRNDFSVWMDNRSPTAGFGNDLLNEHRDQPGIEYWFQDTGVIILRFDSDNRIADKQFLTMRVSTSRQRVIRLMERYGW